MPLMTKTELRKLLDLPDKKLLISTARLSREKNIILLLKTLISLPKEYHLVLVGGGPHKNGLQKLAKKFKVDDQVTFSGRIPHKQISQYYSAADIFVFPSTTETFGNVILEAYASGLPTVGVNEGGVVDLIMDGYTGFIAEAKNPNDIAEKVDIFINNPE